jgi:S-adenosylmethionine hydrolase
MKGVILSVNPSAAIVDITHHVDPQDIFQAASIIHCSFRYFPEGTTHIVVVDPGVGSDRAIIALRRFGHVFLAPDNGVLTLLYDEAEVEPAVQVDNQDYFLKTISQTFHGRDIFAPVGAHISLGKDIKSFGKPVSHKDLVRIDIEKPYISKAGELIGAIVWIDRFGNLITNIEFRTLNEFCRSDVKKNCRVIIGSNTIDELSENYANIKSKRPLAIIGSRGYLEIAVNCGHAAEYFGAEKGDPVKVICR